MPPLSPTRAFEPTPALLHNNFSGFNGIHRHSSVHSCREGQGKEVRFGDSEIPSSVHGRHSIATSNVPLLPAVSSASHVPKQSFRITNPTPGVDISAYFEHCRDVNEQLRHAHTQERKAWEIERISLKTRIADLEFKLNKANGGRRRLSNDSPFASTTSLKSELSIPHVAAVNNSRHHSIAASHMDHFKNDHSKPVWQPESPLPATRVFAHDDDIQHLASISEDKPFETLSPQRSQENKPIPIQEIDETLDGITVKSEGVKSSFNKVMSPIIIASPGRSPSPKQKPPEPPRLTLDPFSVLDPLEAKLTRHAGHTPLAFDGILSSTASTDGPTPQQEKPLAPAPSARPPLRPSERSESYFSTNDVHATTTETIWEDVEPEKEVEPEPYYETADDRPLTGPLMLDASGKSELSHSFLEQLDHKLLEEVRRSQTSSPALQPGSRQQSKKSEDEKSNKSEDENFPRLRLKKSTNFGSAYGVRIPGVCE
ncbi:hypothetical protein LTS08_002286 [Lithohypha guttulata]|nr:hypothetical protein LTS08_002286 [Lithohypha guttulata]